MDFNVTISYGTQTGSRCSWKQFTRTNRGTWSRSELRAIRESLLTKGETTINLGASGVFTLRLDYATRSTRRACVSIGA